MYKTSRLVRISLLINALNKRVLLFFSGKLFYKSNRKLFSCVCIAWYKHERGWENSRQLCKPETKSRVCITVSNSPNPSRVYIRLCKHGKRFLLLKRFTESQAFLRSIKMPHENDFLFMLFWMVIIITKVARCVACSRRKPCWQLRCFQNTNCNEHVFIGCNNETLTSDVKSPSSK